MQLTPYTPITKRHMADKGCVCQQIPTGGNWRVRGCAYQQTSGSDWLGVYGVNSWESRLSVTQQYSGSLLKPPLTGGSQAQDITHLFTHLLIHCKPGGDVQECPGSGQARGMREHSPVPNTDRDGGREDSGEAVPEKYLWLAIRGRAEMVLQAGRGALESEWFWNPQPRQRAVKGEGGQGGGGGRCELRALGLREAVEE